MIAAAIALQLAPLPAAVTARVSPQGDVFAAGADSVRRFSIAPAKTELGFFLFAALALFFLGATKLVSAVGARSVVRLIVAFGVVLALIGIIQYVVTGGAPKSSDLWLLAPRFQVRPFGPFVNRNHFAGWMIMVLPLAFGGAQAAWESGQALAAGDMRDRITWLSSPSGAGTLLMILAVAVMGLALVMCESRSGMAGFTAGAALFAWIVIRRQRDRRSKIATAVVFAVAVAGVAAWAGIDRVRDRVSSVRADASSAGGRRQTWADAMRIVRDFPVTGTGLDTFGTAMLVYQSDRELHFEEAHNDYLQLAAEGGLLLGVPIIAAFVVFAVQVRRRFVEAPRYGWTYWLRVGAVVGLLSIAMQSAVDFSLQMPGNAALFAVVAAIAVHQSPNLRSAHGDARRAA